MPDVLTDRLVLEDLLESVRTERSARDSLESDLNAESISEGGVSTGGFISSKSKVMLNTVTSGIRPAGIDPSAVTRERERMHGSKKDLVELVGTELIQ